jgi:hypothetical protein
MRGSREEPFVPAFQCCFRDLSELIETGRSHLPDRRRQERRRRRARLKERALREGGEELAVLT